MKRVLLSFIFICSVLSSYACTSFIISGKATPSGKPMMFKHRDTGELNNRIAHFQGTKYAFIGLMNSPTLDGEVWSGMNEVGFCIMNTASYNLRNDSYDCAMDREGELMYHALANCANLSEFEQWLETYPKPWGVEANFGIIDAEGGAAYYEMNNDSWIKYDVNAEDDGYRVVTNFSFAGRYDDYEGYERYLTASAIMKENFSRNKEFSAIDAINLFSRQYRHELLGWNYTADNTPELTVDQDFIPRRITSAVVCFEGVKAGADPIHSIMWTALGYPACAVAMPLMMNKTSIPAYMLARDKNAKKGEGLHSELCDLSLQIKDKYIFPHKISNGKRYLNTQVVLQGIEGKPSLLDCTNKVEQQILADFLPLYEQWNEGALSNQAFFKLYDVAAKKWLKTYTTIFAPYLK